MMASSPARHPPHCSDYRVSRDYRHFGIPIKCWLFIIYINYSFIFQCCNRDTWESKSKFLQWTRIILYVFVPSDY